MNNLRSVCLLAVLACLPVEARTRGRVWRASFEATAYVLRGKTASGIRAQRGEVAADARVLPKGTLIRVRNAGRYSGEYVVADTGPDMRGRRIDIFVHSERAAKEFGRRKVTVEVIRRGEGPVE